MTDGDRLDGYQSLKHVSLAAKICDSQENSAMQEKGHWRILGVPRAQALLFPGPERPGEHFEQNKPTKSEFWGRLIPASVWADRGEDSC